MYKNPTKTNAKKILLIGGGETDFGLQGETDVAIYQVIPLLKKMGYQPYVLDDNPYALSLESTVAETVIAPLTVTAVQSLIQKEGIEAVLPVFGGRRAVRLWGQVLSDWQDERNGFQPETLGLPVQTVQDVRDGRALMERLALAELPILEAEAASSSAEANQFLRDYGLPLVIRAHHPKVGNTQRIVDRLDDFDQAIEQVRAQSLTNDVLISRAINGMKEVSLLVARDQRGNTLQIGASEDMDPIGIHSSDSLSVAPVLTVADRVLEEMRSQAFLAAEVLGVQGFLHVQFAFDEKTDALYIIKVAPYLDLVASRLALVTGYPAMLVGVQLALGLPITAVTLPQSYHQKLAMMEPVMDHIAVKLPIFSFGDLAAAGVTVNRQLGSIQKSVGSALGFGRTFIEALEKAIRAAHFNNRSFSPEFMDRLTDDELIQQLIHPQDNRVLLLIEALRRGYEVDELSELTDIDEFYFYQLQRLIAIQQKIEAAPGNQQMLQIGKESGLSDGLIARFWQRDFQTIRAQGQLADILPTYKALEPTAGEFPEHAHQYYATFESENESSQLGQQSVLIVGAGAFRMGDGAAAGYVLTVALAELRRLNYQTIVLNNSAADASLLPHLSDKQYLEPLETSDVMAVVDQEAPQAILVPGNRRKLIDALQKLGQTVFVLPKEKHQPDGPDSNQSEFNLSFFYDGQRTYPLALTQHRQGELRLLKNTIPADFLADLQPQQPGFYQIIWRRPVFAWQKQVPMPDLSTDAWLRPMPYGHLAYLSKVLGLPLVRYLIRALVGQLSPADQEQLLAAQTMPQKPLAMVAGRSDFALHLQPDQVIDATRFEMGPRLVAFEQED
ncbi:ATP-grasp domain-containing protein [Leuconostocaceae bacterium ESL0958]|nr:ATP-grasp domain-containing protein [Leuconostocaceae bacterium ESL0958]